YIQELEHPNLGKIRVPSSPIKMSKHETGARHFAPELGQHTEEILLEMGYSWDEVAALKDQQVI
ncbi:MAG: CoA transferase, partial [Dehalococcoidia bacterium]|nr:CoA transferase [Dehalococcoidia bacterium]